MAALPTTLGSTAVGGEVKGMWPQGGLWVQRNGPGFQGSLSALSLSSMAAPCGWVGIHRRKSWDFLVDPRPSQGPHPWHHSGSRHQLGG